MQTKKLEIVEKREMVTLKETIEEREVFYQYEIINQKPTPTVVNFSIREKDGKTMGGFYSVEGGLNFNGNNISQTEDLEIVKSVFATILEIINPKN